ncbi:ABC transporter ATP-binding protein [Agromyces aerolatus]|uniref:ABC transporter ATP-binding protein n=1 Tax=Agromyces sp. LY-1074 TaxID=3074080 RepID=UPI0028563022|nr:MULTISPECIES: ATP-binding cassette domain-containing protein [unclassified Agromyces]MDR5698604.1 ATP-binding cassette domain-containing protein [Agromyces sp. LY-1074]MDR5704898.1 ATP-binding cassette domain-containing protein [Agromyces sp. LY-1358]
MTSAELREPPLHEPPLRARPLLELDDVRIRHAGAETATPSGVTLDVRPGEVVLVLGPSGCGKSTLTLALNGLIPHAVPAEIDGRIRVAGLDTAEHPVGVLSAHVAMVFQDPDAQVVTGSVLDEVAFGPENQLVPADEVLARAERALKLVGLWERRGDNPDRLSGGGRQRLAIACALAMASPVLVLDEPTANLDPAGIDEVYAVLRELAGERDHAIVLVEHNLDAAVDIVDRVVVLDRDGRLIADGPAGDVLRARADELAALGVWLPVSTLAAMRLRDAGVVLDPLPLSPSELAAALDAEAALPAPVAHAPRRRSAAQDVTDAPGITGAPGMTDAPGWTDTSRAADARPAVRVRGLSVQRGGRRGPTVVHDVDLDVAAGDFLAIVGTNGAGKTSLLQAVSGVIPARSGTIDVLGLDPSRADARARGRRIGFVFQNPEHQFVAATVAEELHVGLRQQDLPDAERDEIVERMLRRFGLDALRAQHPFLLSGGQKRRLSVGTALIAGPPVLALDEPTFGQDRGRAAELLDMLRQLNDEGTTVLVVTHDLQLVADHATHTAVMADGRLIGVGPTSEVLTGPLIEQAGLRHPPLARATRGLTRHPAWRTVTRLAQLPSAGGAL